MGLDLVEVTIRIEEAFGISIPDEVAADLTTPRQVKFYVLSQLKLTERKTCMSQQAFYLLRREFVPVLGVKRSDFRPSSSFAQLIATNDRVPMWTTLRSKIGANTLPDLARPAWLFKLLTVATMATGLATFQPAFLVTGRIDVALLLSLLAAGAFGYAGALITRRWKYNFRRGYEHAGELAEHVAIVSPHSFKKEWTSEEVAQTLRQLIIHETGVTDFTEDSRFVEDMHLD
jgi:hypothetical protein